MKASELIKALNTAINQHGDLTVYWDYGSEEAGSIKYWDCDWRGEPDNCGITRNTEAFFDLRSC